jgi:hypothetical protein
MDASPLVGMSKLSAEGEGDIINSCEGLFPIEFEARAAYVGQRMFKSHFTSSFFTGMFIKKLNDRSRSRPHEVSENWLKDLHVKIGPLTLGVDFLERTLVKAGLPNAKRLLTVLMP